MQIAILIHDWSLPCMYRDFFALCSGLGNFGVSADIIVILDAAEAIVIRVLGTGGIMVILVFVVG